MCNISLVTIHRVRGWPATGNSGRKQATGTKSRFEFNCVTTPISPRGRSRPGAQAHSLRCHSCTTKLSKNKGWRVWPDPPPACHMGRGSPQPPRSQPPRPRSRPLPRTPNHRPGPRTPAQPPTRRSRQRALARQSSRALARQSSRAVARQSSQAVARQSSLVPRLSSLVALARTGGKREYTDSLRACQMPPPPVLRAVPRGFWHERSHIPLGPHQDARATSKTNDIARIRGPFSSISATCGIHPYAPSRAVVRSPPRRFSAHEKPGSRETSGCRGATPLAPTDRLTTRAGTARHMAGVVRIGRRGLRWRHRELHAGATCGASPDVARQLACHRQPLPTAAAFHRDRLGGSQGVHVLEGGFRSHLTAHSLDNANGAGRRGERRRLARAASAGERASPPPNAIQGNGQGRQRSGQQVPAGGLRHRGEKHIATNVQREPGIVGDTELRNNQ